MIPNYIGTSKYPQMIKKDYNDTIEEKDTIYIGEECDKYKGILKIRYPLIKGIFEKEEDILSIFNYIKSKFPNQEDIFKDRSVLIAEPILNNYTFRHKISDILFNTFDISAIFFASQPILSLYASGNSTGIVLESGAAITQCCGVYEGYSIPKTFMRYDYGGKDITEYLNILLKKKGITFTTSAEYQLVNTIKEQLCEVALNDIKDISNNKTSTEFSLPDNTKINIGEERYIAPEIMFNPSLIGLEALSYHEMIYNSISNVDIDLRKNLFYNVLVTGGNTSFKYFKERFYRELKKLIKQRYSTKNGIKLRMKYPENNRKYMAWVGASLLTSLNKFTPLWITKTEYHEQGSGILFKKTI